MIVNKELILFIFLMLLMRQAISQPVLDQSFLENGLKIYPDQEIKSRFYYDPGDLVLIRDEGGKPELSFLQMRYTGNSTNADKGENFFKSILQFKVIVTPPDPGKLEGAIKDLGEKIVNAELRPLPLRKMEAAVIFVPVNPGAEQKRVLKGGTFENDETGTARDEGIWSQKIFNLNLDNESSQILRYTLETQKTILSIYYGYYAVGVNSPQLTFSLNGDTSIENEMKGYFEGMADFSLNNSEPLVKLIKANTFAVEFDAKKYPDCLKKIDLNEQLSPEYAALEVRCYDFNNELRPDLYAKYIEIEAKGLGNGNVTQVIKFKKSQPDEYVKSIRFPYAVRIDKPYKYRVTDISNNGNQKKKNWVDRNSWTGIIDITSQSQEINAILKPEEK